MDRDRWLTYLWTVKTDSDSARTWHCLQCAVPAPNADDLTAICFDLGSCGLQTDDRVAVTHLSAYFPASLQLSYLQDAIRRALHSFGLDVELRATTVAEQDWGEEWRRFFRPVWATPRIVVHPSWIPVDITPSQLAITIDPKMAFGTGGHESTRLCLRALEHVLVPGDHCFDLGTGSGVLTIAAVKLGAATVLAVDMDPPAIQNARENLALNSLGAERITLLQGSIERAAEGTYQVVMANIRSSVLTPMLPELSACAAAGGAVLLSGLLRREQSAFVAAVEVAGMAVRRVEVEGEWICVTTAGGRS
jgi:ribosomal protein L11 methyltransferase